MNIFLVIALLIVIAAIAGIIMHAMINAVVRDLMVGEGAKISRDDSGNTPDWE